MSAFLEYYGQRNVKTLDRKFTMTQHALFSAFVCYQVMFDDGDLNKQEFRDIIGLFDSLWDYSA